MAESNRVTYHHEGAGSPTDNVERFLNTDNYSIGIGVTRTSVRRSPNQSFRTTGQPKGPSLQVCFSGDRNKHPLRDEDLELAKAAIAEARGRGWIGDNPAVFLHGDTDSTACPGTNVKNRRAELFVISKASAPLPEVVKPMWSPPLHLVPLVAELRAPTGGVWLLGEDGSVYAFGGAPFHGGPNGQTYWQGRRAARLEPNDKGGYTVVATSGERYAYP